MIRKSVTRLQAYVPGEQPRDPGIIKLNTNENPYPPSPAVAEVLRSFAVDRLGRYPDPAATELRETLAQLHSVTPDRVFVGNGSDEILALCTRAFVEHDGRIGWFEPSYSLYPVLAAIRDVPGCPVDLPEDFGWCAPEPSDVSLFFLTNPNAPTSLCFPHDEVAAFAARSRAVVVLDEAYVDFADRDHLDTTRACANTLVVRTLSKSYSLAGIRLGYAVGHPELIGALERIKDSYNVNALSQALAVAAVRDQDSMRENVRRIRRTRERLREGLLRVGFDVCASQTNFIWAKPPGGNAEPWFRYLRDRRILVRYFPGRRTGAYLRITVGTDEQVDVLLAAASAG